MSDKVQYHWYKSHGICVRCHRDDAITGRIHCEACQEIVRAQERAYYHEKVSCDPEKMERSRASRRAYYQRLKAEGMCVDCAKRPAQNGRVRCAVCAAKGSAKSLQRYYKRKGR